MVKLEGAAPHKLDAIRYLSQREIPVCAHLGLTPQSVLRLGGYKVQGREAEAARRLRDDARAVAEAGADLLVLECVPTPLAAVDHPRQPDPDHRHRCRARTATARCWCCTICSACDSGHRRPRFVKDFLAEGGSVQGAIGAYAGAVRSGAFPDAAHAYA